MAGDWLKVEVSLPDKPEVWQIAGMTGLDPDSVVGKLFKVWRWFDAHTENGNAAGVTYALVDSISGVTGFAESMALCGWLEQEGSALLLPHFDRHNGKTAKNRALTAKRVASHKSKSNDDSVTAPLPRALPREEKRREEKKDKEASSASPPADLFPGIDRQVVEDFKKLRRQKGAAITETAMAGIKREAEKAGLTMEAALRICCERGWQGFKADWMRDRAGGSVSGGEYVAGGGRRAL